MVQIRVSVDQDINFTVEGIPCRMSLDTTGEGSKGDLWIIQRPNNELFENKRVMLDLEKALERLAGWDGQRMPIREPRQRYSWRVDYEYRKYIWLQVAVVDLEDALEYCIMIASDEWDGNTLNFTGSQRLARLLADWKDAFPDIQFIRSDGTPIEYQPYVESGGRTPTLA